VLAPRPAGGPPDDTADRYVYDLYFRDATAAIPAGTGATLEGFVPDEGELVASDEEEVEEEDLGDEDSNGSWAGDRRGFQECSSNTLSPTPLPADEDFYRSVPMPAET